jgi:hypothetical protein
VRTSIQTLNGGDQVIIPLFLEPDSVVFRVPLGFRVTRESTPEPTSLASLKKDAVTSNAGLR